MPAHTHTQKRIKNGEFKWHVIFPIFPSFERNKGNVLGNLLATSWAETDLSAGHF